MSGKRARGRGRRPVTREEVPVRERILAAATRLFYAEGIERVGVDRVLAEADAARASLYQHFGSKAGLVTAYLEAKGAEVRPQLEGLLADRSVPPRDRLLRLFDAIAGMAAGAGFRGCPYQNAAAELTEPGDPALRLIAGQQAWLHALIGRVVRESPALAAQPMLVPALVTLYSGALAAAQLERCDTPARAARWAAERLLAG